MSPAQLSVTSLMEKSSSFVRFLPFPVCKLPALPRRYGQSERAPFLTDDAVGSAKLVDGSGLGAALSSDAA
jgi:hypothetical protein